MYQTKKLDGLMNAIEDLLDGVLAEDKQRALEAVYNKLEDIVSYLERYYNNYWRDNKS